MRRETQQKSKFNNTKVSLPQPDFCVPVQFITTHLQREDSNVSVKLERNHIP